MIEDKYGYSGTMFVSDKKNNRGLYKHQQHAIRALNNTNKDDHHKGLLVIPTGGGKTFTAVYYLLNQIIDKNKKVLWVAHRHELLNQTLNTVGGSLFKEVIPNRKSFRYRIISGKHDRPVNIQMDDDFIIASKDSLVKGSAYIEKWISENKDNICLVIDEAHHAVAKTYRTIINLLEDNSNNWSKLLGLTATPIRTSENEKGLLKKIFKDDIIYSIDLSTLIAKGILAKPYFESINTEFTLDKELTSKELDFIRRSGNLPDDIAEFIVKNTERNSKIVEQYIKNKKMYGKTLVFAINVMHAIQLNTLFNAKGVRCDFVVSSIKDAGTGVTISAEENERKIKAFRNGELDVLVNVNILTEGTDIPNIQTIFLTRQTTSKILLNQMIGRGLRGVKAGGTEHANIVSFIDNWKYKINWISPRELDIFNENAFNEGNSAKRKYEERSILIKLIEDFTLASDKLISSSEALQIEGSFEAVGGYKFTLLNEDEEKDCTVIVFGHIKDAYKEFLDNIHHVQYELNLNENSDSQQLDKAVNLVVDKFFIGYDLFGFNKKDVEDILKYYIAEGITPDLVELEIPKIVKGNKVPVEPGKIIVDEIDFKKLSLAEIRRLDEKYWRKLRDDVFEKYKDNEGNYYSATGLYKNTSKWFFQIDHIKPISKGGKTVLDNLQLLTRWENQLKGNDEISIDKLIEKLNKGMDKMSVEDLEEQLNHSHFVKEDKDKTIEIIKRIQEIQPESTDAYTIMADIKLQEEKYTAALIQANKALKINPNNSLALYIKGEAYYFKENHKECIKWLEMSLRESKIDDYNIYKYLGDSYFNLKKKDIAFSYYTKVLEITSSDIEILADSYFSIGEIYFSKRKYQEAMDNYKKSLEYDNTVPEAYNNIGVCYQRLKNEDKALKYYMKAYELDSTCKLYQNNIRNIKCIN